MLTIIARADCPHCHGSGTVTDLVDCGDTAVPMDSDCEDCVTAGWPDGAPDDARYELLPAWVYATVGGYDYATGRMIPEET